MNFLIFLGIFLGGGAGAFCRFSLDSLIKKHWSHPLPVGTLTINMLGSFALGWLTAFMAGALSLTWGSEATRAASLVIGTGFLGGFTTFSTAMVEAVSRVKVATSPGAKRSGERGVLGALFLLFGQAVLCFVVAGLGLALGGAVS